MGIRVDGLRDGCYQFECSRCRRIFCRFFGSPRTKSRGFPSPSGVGVPERFQEVFLKRLRWTAAALLVSALFLLNSCSSGTGNIPTPSIGTISPDSITAGSADFTLFVSGTGLEADTVGFLDGTSRPSKFNKTTGQVEMSITAADVAVPDASVQVTVANPSPGGTSNALTLVVNPVANGAPAITGIQSSQRHGGNDGPLHGQRCWNRFRANIRRELERKPARHHVREFDAADSEFHHARSGHRWLGKHIGLEPCARRRRFSLEEFPGQLNCARTTHASASRRALLLVCKRFAPSFWTRLPKFLILECATCPSL